MKALSTLIISSLAMVAFSTFVPVPDFDLGHIQGPWNIQSAYDTYGNNWTLTYCFTFTFDIINTSAVNLTSSFYNGFTDEHRVDSVMLYPDPENAAIMYQDVDHEQPPLLVLNESSFPFWQGNKEPLLIIAFNYSNATKDRLIIFGLSKAEDSEYDIRPYLEINHFPVSNTQNFWFINTACDSYFSWTPLNAYNATNLLKDWNLIAVYDPTGAGIVPWYTGDAIFDWTQAYCAKISFKPGRAYDDLMTLSLKSLYEGTFERTWQILPNPENNAILMGFNMDANTLLYISYADMLGNIVLTTGATTSFFLSTKVKTFTPADRLIFNAVLSRAGFTYDASYIYPIDDTVC